MTSEALELRPLKRLIIEKTEGNPFFIEEIIRALLDQGALVRNGAVKVTRSMSEIHIPPTVQGILAARIDCLPADEKGFLQTLAVIGKEFPSGLVRVSHESRTKNWNACLRPFNSANSSMSSLPFPNPRTPSNLTQEVADGSLLIERRESLHEGTARQIEVLFNSRLEDHYGDLAHH